MRIHTYLLALMISTPLAAFAAPVLLVDAGVVTGISGLELDGQSYTGTFQDGTCATLFDGCDSISDFVSSDALDVLDLMTQVRSAIEAAGFDDEPGSFQGCGPSTGCSIQTPYSLTSAVIQFIDTTPPLGSPFSASFDPLRDTATGFSHERITYMSLALTPVPVPAAIWFFGSALFGLFGLRKLKK